MRIVSPTGWARFSWQSDYGQFYLIDRADADFVAPEDITAEMIAQGWAAPADGLTVYTADSLQQQVRIEIYAEEPDHSPVEEMSGGPWTRVAIARVRFPSRAFTISSPSAPTPLPGGPWFLLDQDTVTARISWLEFQGVRDDSVPAAPDVIRVAMWP